MCRTTYDDPRNLNFNIGVTQDVQITQDGNMTDAELLALEGKLDTPIAGGTR